MTQWRHLALRHSRHARRASPGDAAMASVCGLLAIALLSLCATAKAYVNTSHVGWDQRPGEQLPLQLQFRDEANRSVRLSDYFGRTPVILVLAYFSCPQLCPVVLHSVEESLRSTGLAPGRDYELVVVSFEPRDTPSAAQQDKSQLLKSPPAAEAAHFLTAADGSGATLAHSIGLRYVYDEEHGQFAHAAGFLIATPQGEISRYFLGVGFPSWQVRAAVLDAAGGRNAGFADQLLLLCYHFDPTQGRYSLAILNGLRVVTLAGLVLTALALWRLAVRQTPGAHGMSRTRKNQPR